MNEADVGSTQECVERCGSGLHVCLRSSTAALHHQVEKTFDLKRRIATLPGYHEALFTLRDIHRSVQQSFDLLAREGVVIHRGLSKARIEWLDQDLTGLDASTHTPQVAQLVLRSADEALGCLYVIEGATLGGQHIFRIVQRRFGFDERRGARYFFGLGDQTAEAWAAFVARLDGQPDTASDGALEGARRTFKLFTAGLGGETPV